MSTKYSLEKFDTGEIYFVKVFDQDKGITKIAAIINLREIKSHAQYELTVLNCENSELKAYPFHGSFLTLDNILTMASSVLRNEDNPYKDVKRQ